MATISGRTKFGDPFAKSVSKETANEPGMRNLHYMTAQKIMNIKIL